MALKVEPVMSYESQVVKFLVVLSLGQKGYAKVGGPPSRKLCGKNRGHSSPTTSVGRETIESIGFVDCCEFSVTYVQ